MVWEKKKIGSRNSWFLQKDKRPNSNNVKMDVKRLGLILLSPALDKWMQTIYKLHNLNVLSRSNGMYKTASHSTMAHRAHSMTFHGHANVINSLYAGMVMCCCTKKNIGANTRHHAKLYSSIGFVCCLFFFTPFAPCCNNILWIKY